MCWCLMSWVQQVHNAAVVARSLGCQYDTEMPTGRTLNGNPLLWWCAEYIERFINVEAYSQCYSAYQVARFRAEPLIFRE